MRAHRSNSVHYLASTRRESKATLRSGSTCIREPSCGGEGEEEEEEDGNDRRRRRRRRLRIRIRGHNRETLK